MRFFDTKEEVIDIQLTPYGKHLLSKGKWKPVYYEFYDDDIVYDSQYIGFQEGQESIAQRIQDTKRTRTQYTFKSPATGSFLSKESSIEKRNTLRANFLPLGDSSLINKQYPSLKIKMLSGEISASMQSAVAEQPFNGSQTLELKNSIYKISKNTSNNLEDTSQIQRIYEDGSLIETKEQEILIDISELGIDSKIDNFEISFMEIDESGKEIKKISFVDDQKPTKIVNNVLIDNEDYPEYEEKLLNNDFEKPQFINYFLEVNTDKDIDQNILCKYLNKEEILRLKIVEGYDIDCDGDDISVILSTNPSTLITEEEN
jgi:hypothetical protein